nr:monodehydroascorbate reductase [Tanacetum cinerariifolium]
MADVPEIYMQEFWAIATVHQHSIRFKMDTRKHIVDLESFREMLHISPRVPGQSFVELPFEEEILEFLRFLRHSAQIKTLTDVNVNKLYQPWRSFAAVINKCLTGKSTGFDSLRLSQAQILWGLYHNRNFDYAFLIWEDLVYQAEHKNQKKSNEMYYPRFTKVIIHHFMTKNPSIPRQNRVNWHYVRDDILFSTINVVSRHQNTQQYGAILPIELTTEDIRNTKAYKEYYACATEAAAPKPKASAKKKKGGSASSITLLTPIATPTPTTTVVATPRLSAVAKGKQPTRATSPTDPLDVERTEVEQLKIVLRRSRHETHISQQGGSSTDEGTVICLSKGQRFNFSRYIFDSLVRNVDSSSKFYMYPRFIQLIIKAQVVDLSSHTTCYISPALTQKVFANMRRVKKGCSGVETPLFKNMLQVRDEDAEEEVQVLAHDAVDQENVVEETADDVAQPTSSLPSSPIVLPSPPHQSPRTSPSQAAEGTSILVQQVLDKYSALVHRVEGLESNNTAQKLEILKLKARVKKLERLNKVKSSKLRRLKKVGTFQRIESSEDDE